MNKIILLGDGGHASVVKNILNESGNEDYVVCLENNNKQNSTNTINEKDIYKLKPNEINLVNGIGFMPKTSTRKNIYEKFKGMNYSFLKVVSSHSIISNDAFISEGAHIFPGSVINANAHVGQNCIINTGSIIEHDSYIGDHTHICPGTIICGGTKIGRNTFIGAGTCIIQNIEIGDNVTVSAGSVVKENIYS